MCIKWETYQKSSKNHLSIFWEPITQWHLGRTWVFLWEQGIRSVRNSFTEKTKESNFLPCHGEIKQSEELSKWRLVHDAHERHLCDEEVQDTPPGGHGSVLLTRAVYLDFRFRRDLQLLADVESRRLGNVEYVDKIFVINKGPLQSKYFILVISVAMVGKGEVMFLKQPCSKLKWVLQRPQCGGVVPWEIFLSTDFLFSTTVGNIAVVCEILQDILGSKLSCHLFTVNTFNVNSWWFQEGVCFNK